MEDSYVWHIENIPVEERTAWELLYDTVDVEYRKNMSFVLTSKNYDSPLEHFQASLRELNQTLTTDIDQFPHIAESVPIITNETSFQSPQQINSTNNNNSIVIDTSHTELEIPEISTSVETNLTQQQQHETESKEKMNRKRSRFIDDECEEAGEKEDGSYDNDDETVDSRGVKKIDQMEYVHEDNEKNEYVNDDFVCDDNEVEEIEDPDELDDAENGKGPAAGKPFNYARVTRKMDRNDNATKKRRTKKEDPEVVQQQNMALLKLILDPSPCVGDFSTQEFQDELLKSIKVECNRQNISFSTIQLPGDQLFASLLSNLGEMAHRIVGNQTANHLKTLMNSANGDGKAKRKYPEFSPDFKRHKEKVNFWHGNFSGLLEKIEQKGQNRVFPGVEILTIALGHQKYEYYDVELPKLAVGYRCMVTGKILQPGTRVYLFAAQMEKNMVYPFYISKYDKPGKENLYLNSVINIFSLICMRKHIMVYFLSEWTKAHKFTHSESVYERVKTYLQDRTSVFELLTYIIISYNAFNTCLDISVL